MTFTVRRIRGDEGASLRAARLAALADQPGEATTTIARTAKLSEDHWSEAAQANASGGLQATFFAEVPPAASDDGDTAGTPVIVGLVGAYANRDGVVNLVGLWSAPGHRDVGVADELLRAVAQWARDSGARRLRRWVVQRNEHARRFSEGQGFVPTGAEMPYEPDPTIDQVEMILDL